MEDSTNGLRSAAVEPGDRPVALPIAPDHWLSSVPALPETRHQFTRATRGRSGRREPTGQGKAGSGDFFGGCDKHFSGPDESSKLRAADHERAVVRVVLEVEGGGKCARQASCSSGLRGGRALAKPHLLK